MKLSKDTMAECRVTRDPQSKEKRSVEDGMYAFLVPFRVAELGRLPWGLLQEHISSHLHNLGKILKEWEVAEGAATNGSGIDPKHSRRGRECVVEILALLSFSPGGVSFGSVTFTSVHADSDQEGLLDLEPLCQPWMIRPYWEKLGGSGGCGMRT